MLTARDVFIPDGEPVLDPGTQFGSYRIPDIPRAEEVTGLDRLRNQLNSPGEQEQLLRPLYSYSREDSKIFDRPGPVYNPYIDNEDAYAKADPYNMIDVAKKTAQTFGIHLGSSYRTFMSGINEVRKGNWAGFWDNPYAKHLADLTERLEETQPLFRTADERDNPYALRNLTTTFSTFLPMTGTVAAAIGDVVIGHIAATVIGAAFSGGVGAVPANIAMLAKDAQTLRTAFSSLLNVSKALNSGKAITGLASLNALANTTRMSTAARALGTSLFYANGEAALNSEMVARQMIEDRQREHFELTGRYATGDTLEKIQTDARKAGAMNYALTLPLIAGSQHIQFGNFMLGRNARALSATLPVRVATDAAGKLAVKKGSIAAARARAFFGDVFSEGFEEYAQTFIGNAVSDYYSGASKDSLVGSLANHAINDIATDDGLMSFIGGAFIGGGIGGVGSARRSLTGQGLRKQVENELNRINGTTQILLDGYRNSADIKARMEQAFIDEDFDTLDDLSAREAFNFAQIGVMTGTVEARTKLFEDYKGMEIDQFNEMFGSELTEEQRDQYIDSTVRNIQSASAILDKVNQVYGTNPFIKTGWFNSMVSRLSEETQYPSKEIRQRLWEDSKNIISYALYRDTELSEQVATVKKILEDDAYLVTSDLKSAVNTFKAKAKDRAAAGIESMEYTAFLESLEDKTIGEQYADILDFLGFEDDTKDILTSTVKKDVSRRLFQDEVGRYVKPSGHKELLKEIGEYLEYTYGQEKPFTPPKAEETTKAKVEAEIVSDEVYALFKKTGSVTPDIATRLDQKVARGEALTDRERELYDTIQIEEKPTPEAESEETRNPKPVSESEEEPVPSQPETPTEVVEEAPPKPVEEGPDGLPVESEMTQTKSQEELKAQSKAFEEYNKLPLKDKLNQVDLGFNILPKKDHYLVVELGGKEYKGVAINNEKGQTFTMMARPVTDKKLGGGQLITITGSVLRHQVREEPIATQAPPVAREHGVKPATKEEELDAFFEQVSEELYGKVPEPDVALKAIRKFVMAMRAQNLVEIVC